MNTCRQGCSLRHINSSVSVYVNCPRDMVSPRCNVTVSLVPLNRNDYGSISKKKITLSYFSHNTSLRFMIFPICVEGEVPNCPCILKVRHVSSINKLRAELRALYINLRIGLCEQCDITE